MRRRLVVVGGDAAGLSGAAEARRTDPDLEIVVLERGPDVSYSACGLPYWIGGEVARESDLVSHDPAYFAERRDIEVRTGVEATGIDAAAGRVWTQDGEAVGYDALLVATGARPVRPPVPGVDLHGVLILRDMVSARALNARLQRGPARRALVVGTGALGLEGAEALLRRGLEVEAIEVAPRALPALAEPVAAPVVAALDAAGMEVRTGAKLQGIEPDGDGLVVTIDGGTRALDLVLLGTGVAPNAEVAAAAGCALGAGGAIAVDRRGRTSVEGIWAAGDSATAWHLVLERDVWMPLATTATRQGRVAGRDLAGGEGWFPGVLGSWMSTFGGVGFGAVGLDPAVAGQAGFVPREVVREGRDRSGYMPGTRPIVVRLVWDDPTGRLLGGQVAGGGEVAARLHSVSLAVGAGLEVRRLAEADLGYVPPLAPLRDPLQLAAGAAVGDAP
jgi:NADPH-dependent 2,4-dienoyl-CoA reductase/sulfur reductase-like enzyme